MLRRSPTRKLLLLVSLRAIPACAASIFSIVVISGERRYTRQGQPYFANVSNLNQAGFLIGIHF